MQQIVSRPKIVSDLDYVEYRNCRAIGWLASHGERRTRTIAARFQLANQLPVPCTSAGNGNGDSSGIQERWDESTKLFHSQVWSDWPALVDAPHLLPRADEGLNARPTGVGLRLGDRPNSGARHRRGAAVSDWTSSILTVVRPRDRL